MPRKLRIQYAGAFYHVVSRGNRGRAIFLSDVDRRDFITTLGEACLKTGWQVHAFCLMDDHYHLVVETPRPNLSAGMGWLQSAYTIRFNRRHKHRGPVISGRYKAQVVEGRGNRYWPAVCDYVHLNPAVARRITKRQSLASYRWSSFPVYLDGPKHRPGWIQVDRVLRGHGIAEDTAAGRRAFEKRMEAQRARAEEDRYQEWSRLRWCLGSEAFKREQLARLNRKSGNQHRGKLRRPRDAGDRILAEELARLGWTKRELSQRPKGDPEKLAIGARMRRETLLTIKEIAVRVRLGTTNTANARLHQLMREPARTRAVRKRKKNKR
jgi:REP element-mobilizing transposase RayT